MSRLKRPFCCHCQSRLRPALLVEGRGVPHGRAGHQVVFDYTIVSDCSGCRRLHLENLSHDCWTYQEPWDLYSFYRLGRRSSALLRDLMTSCPRPLGRRCGCPLHRGLRRSLKWQIVSKTEGQMKVWEAPSGFEVGGRTFRVKLREHGRGGAGGS